MKEKKWFKSFLNKLSEANKEEYGDKPLDCCKLNKTPKDVKVSKMTRSK